MEEILKKMKELWEVVAVYMENLFTSERISSIALVALIVGIIIIQGYMIGRMGWTGLLLGTFIFAFVVNVAVSIFGMIMLCGGLYKWKKFGAWIMEFIATGRYIIYGKVLAVMAAFLWVIIIVAWFISEKKNRRFIKGKGY